ncbi:MAG: 4-hydroxy-3-methylbut-2-enyl diphosphate reductase [Spirosomataceae bacterium]
MKSFTIPTFYKSSVIGQIKETRRKQDRLKKDFTPTFLDFGPVQIYIARHFGFCYGVENAVEIAYKTLDENPTKRVFLLSEMIHNPLVNKDLLDRGIQFLMDTSGKQLIPWETLTKEDVVIVPAFGTTLEIEQTLSKIGINPYAYNTTCPFVEKVWNRAGQIGERGYTIIVHGKPNHEETRATFSHSQSNAPTLVVKDMAQTKLLADYLLGERTEDQFFEDFKGQFSDGFQPATHLQRIGVVNQTTMLASDTQAISDFLKQTLMQKHQLDDKQIEPYFANTRDTLCYATNDNQEATAGLLEKEADLAVVIGGYNSSNTAHLVELCEEKLPTFYIESADCLLPNNQINHFNLHTGTSSITTPFIPFQNTENPVKILLTCGASCPDSMVESVLHGILSYFDTVRPVEEVIQAIHSENER